MKQFLLVALVLGSSTGFAQIIIPKFPAKVVTDPPALQNICNGNTATLAISVSGSAPITFQWYSNPRNGCEFCDTPLKNDSHFSGVNTSTLSINTSGFFGAGTYYWCAVSNAWGNDYSEDAAIVVRDMPAAPVTTDASSCGPGSLVLKSTAAPKGYVLNWYDAGGTLIQGQTTTTYTTPKLSTTTSYYVSVWSGYCESSKSIVTAYINTVAPPTATGGSSCGPASIKLVASGAKAGQFKWYTSAGIPISGQTNDTYNTPVLSSTTSYSVTIFTGGCESPATNVTATIYPVPVTPGATGNSACGSGAITLNATGGTAGQYRWYTGAGVLIAGQTSSAYTTPVITTTTNYAVALNNGNCEGAKKTVTATINALPAAPGATGNAACGSGAITLNATGGTAGQFRWYTSAGVLIAGQTNNSYTTGVLTTSTNYSVAINNGSCEGSKTNVTATINPVPAAPGATGNAACGPAAITLNATGGVAGQYRWYSGAGVLIAGQTVSTYTTPVLTTTTNFGVSINNGTCEGAKTNVIATINPLPAAPGATGNSACGSGAITLNATGGVAGQYRWYTAAGVLIAGQTNSAYTTGVLSSTTNYSVAINNGSCEGVKTNVTATINSPPAMPGATGNASCGPAAITLNATGAAAGQYRWYTSAGVIIAGQTSPSYITPVLGSTTGYLVSINNGVCEGPQTSVTATIISLPSSPTTTDASSCSASALTLKATGASNGQYRWYNGAGIIAGEVNSTYTTPLLTTTTFYSVSINNGACESAKVQVVAQINSPSTVPGVSAGSSCGPGSVTLTASGASDGQYRWFDASGTAINGEVHPQYTTAVLSVSSVFFVSIFNGACESGRSQVTAAINPVPTAPVVTSSITCTGQTSTLTATGGSNGQYRWYTEETGGTQIAGATNSTFITPVLTSTATYYVAINNGNCESVRTSIVIVLTPCNNEPPVIDGTISATIPGGIVTIDLRARISDPDNNLDFTTLKILKQPGSGAKASINASYDLILDYHGIAFSGIDDVTIEICDLDQACTQQEFKVEVDGEIHVYQGISPNGDGKNEVWIIQNIDLLPDTKVNHISIFDRWGDSVYEVDNYDNATKTFTGLNSSGSPISGGTYFYKIQFGSGRKTVTGFLEIRR